MKHGSKKQIFRIWDILTGILERVLCLGICLWALLGTAAALITGRWYSVLLQGIVTFLLLACFPQIMDFRPECRVEKGGIWFRDYRVTIPFSEIRMAKSCTCPGFRSSTTYVLQFMLSPTVFLDETMGGERLRKKLRGRNYIEISMLEKRQYDDLCKEIQKSLRLQDISDEPFPE